MGWRVPMVQGKEVLMIKLGLGFYSILFYSSVPSHPIPFHSCFGSNGAPPEMVQRCISFKTAVLNPGIIQGL